jgi:endonuclease III
MDRQAYFLEIFEKAKKKFAKSTYRLAGDGWSHGWQTLITTIMSAQSRDETTIPIAEALFSKYPTLERLSGAKYSEVLSVLKSMNYNRTKSRHVIEAAQYILNEYHGKIPDSIDDLTKIPGVGRKTANLVISEVHNKEGICVDTHVHRIANVIGLVTTKTPQKTEEELKKIAPKKCWSRINRYFVLWGKQAPGRDKDRLLAVLVN